MRPQRHRSIYASPRYLQRGHVVDTFLGGLFRSVRPLFWSRAKSLGSVTVKAFVREALCTGSRILSDITDKAPDVRTCDMISKYVSASTQNLIGKLRIQGRKRKRAAAPKNVDLIRGPKLLKGTSFLNSHHSSFNHACSRRVRECRVRCFCAEASTGDGCRGNRDRV
jgi:hypothetical protein